MKKLLLIAIAVMLLVGSTALVQAKGPKSHEKATGGVELWYDDWHYSFNAHEGPEIDEGKGMILAKNPDGRQFKCVVEIVRVEPDEDKAYFAGKVIWEKHPTLDPPPNVGRWHVVGIYDGGSPGNGFSEDDTICNDLLSFGWFDSRADAVDAVEAGLGPYPDSWITGGNLVVHP